MERYDAVKEIEKEGETTKETLIQYIEEETEKMRKETEGRIAQAEESIQESYDEVMDSLDDKIKLRVDSTVQSTKFHISGTISVGSLEDA